MTVQHGQPTLISTLTSVSLAFLLLDRPFIDVATSSFVIVMTLFPKQVNCTLPISMPLENVWQPPTTSPLTETPAVDGLQSARLETMRIGLPLSLHVGIESIETAQMPVTGTLQHSSSRRGVAEWVSGKVQSLFSYNIIEPCDGVLISFGMLPSSGVVKEGTTAF